MHNMTNDEAVECVAPEGEQDETAQPTGKMCEMTVRLRWDESAGPLWMNIDNLCILLYTDQAVKREHLQVEVVEP